MYSTRYAIILGLLLTGATAAAHGWALADGLFLDDHWHRLRLENDPWSLRTLLEATTIMPERFMETWWQEKSIQWQYARPVAVLVSKVVYHLSGGSVKAWHAVSVLLHLAGALMVHHLCLRLTRRRFWSVVGALLFVVYSHSVYAVGWLAAQNSVLQTTLTLGALLCYLRASGLNLYAGVVRREQEPTVASQIGRSESDPTSRGLQPARPHVPPLKPWSFVAAAVLWSLALLSRESAIVLPVFAVAFDLAFGGWRHARMRWHGYLIMSVIVLAFAAWRLLSYQPMPDFYFRRYDGPAYLLWWVVKLMHYLTAAVWLSPLMFGPTVRYNPLTEVPGDCLLMLTILAVMSTGYYLACRRARGYWIWPLWILLAVLPVVPVMATPQSGYMPGVGFAVAMVLGPALRREIKPVSIGRWSPGVALWFLIATTIYVPIYRAMWYSVQAAERLTIARVAASPPPRDATDLFFINLPFVNIYAQPHLREAWERGAAAGSRDGMSDVRCHVLTYSSNVLRMDQRCRIEQLDAYSFSLSIVEGRPYFSGALGRFLIESMRCGGRMHPGEAIERDLFDVRIVRADQEGVHELLFRFRDPLADDKYCFYVTTSRCAAARIKFWGPEEPRGPEPLSGTVVRMDDVNEAARRLNSGDAEAADTLLAVVDSDDTQVRSAAWAAFRRVARPVADALAAPVQDVLGIQDPPAADWTRVRQWWHRCVDDGTLDALWVRRDDFAPRRWTRDRLFRIRAIAARIIRTDLYLTGPPFPGPR